MQPPRPGTPPPPPGRRPRSVLVTAGILTLAAAAVTLNPGCGGETATATKPRAGDKPHAGVSLTLSCPDPAYAAALGPLARAWAARTGATVTVSPAPMAPGDAADVGIIPPHELGAWAER